MRIFPKQELSGTGSPAITTAGGRAMRIFLKRAAPFVVLVTLLAGFVPAQAADSIVRVRGDVVVPVGTSVDFAVALGGDVLVDGSVEENAVALGGSVHLGPGAVVRGDVVSVGGAVTRQAGARVDGQTTVVDYSRVVPSFMPFAHGWWHWRPWEPPAVPGVIPLLGLIALALLTAALAPRTVELLSSAIEQGPVGAFFWGLLGSVSIIPVAFMLLISIIGIVLIPLELLSAGIAFFLGYVGTSRLVGMKILAAARLEGRPMILETLLGMAALWLVSQAPFIGWLVMAVAMIMGLGAVITGLFGRLARGPRQSERVEEEEIPDKKKDGV